MLPPELPPDPANTVTLAVPLTDSPPKSLAWNWKLSLPTNPVSGVYTSLLSITCAVPFEDCDTMLTRWLSPTSGSVTCAYTPSLWVFS